MKTNVVTNHDRISFSTKQLVIIGMFAALSYVLQLIHLPFRYLGFLEFEFSDIPAVVAALAYGPLAGIVIELIKNLIKGLTATTTSGIGELANFIVSSAFILPTGLLYRLKKKKPGAAASKNAVLNGRLILTFVAGILLMATVGALMNYYVMLPLYAKLFGGMDLVIGAAAANLPAIKSLAGLVIIGITPFNIVKGIVISLVGYYTFRFLRGRVLM